MDITVLFGGGGQNPLHLSNLTYPGLTHLTRYYPVCSTRIDIAYEHVRTSRSTTLCVKKRFLDFPIISFQATTRFGQFPKLKSQILT